MKCKRTYVLKKKIMQLTNSALIAQCTCFGSRAVHGKRFLESNASSTRLGYVKVPRIEEAFD